MQSIRNFSIIAHVDHGKSTLADRFLELTGTIEKRVMRDQVLDQMELERERGITIKMAPVRMIYHPKSTEHSAQSTNKAQNTNIKSLSSGSWALGSSDSAYVLNLIDTPGHIDFSYEVSRALKAVEGSILLVDATQGIQAQTLTTLGMAQKEGLAIIPVVSKIDSPLARVDEVRKEVCKLLSCEVDKVVLVSGKTGEGVEKLLEEVIKRIPAPTPTSLPLNKGEVQEGVKALIFDFKYSNHKGVIVFVRVFEGAIKRGDRLKFVVAGREFQALEVGVFTPEETPGESLQSGEIGYIVTGIKEPGIASVGDTVSSASDQCAALPGYDKPHPVVWASVYPENANDFNELRASLGKLRLSDASFTYEQESSAVLGNGFRMGFLGMLHLEIISERLRREFNLNLIVTAPTVGYRYENNKVYEPWALANLFVSPEYLNAVVQLLREHEAEIRETESFGLRAVLKVEISLRELMRGFFDKFKATTSGYGSISYNISGERQADVIPLEILVAGEVVPAFTKIISSRRVTLEAEAAVDKLFEILPRQMFTLKIQAKALGRIIASRTLSGMKKDVTAHMYGGDITRKMKLREKQKKGKKKMKERGRVNIPQEVFVKMLRS